MGVDDDLHHQHRGRDQQHAGNRGERGVEVLDHIIDPAADIAGEDAEQHRQRQHHQRGQGADQQAGAYALEREVEHVLPHLVGTEDVVAAAERDRDAEQQQDRQQRQGDGADRRPPAPTFNISTTPTPRSRHHAAASSSQTTSPPAQPRETRMAMSNSCPERSLPRWHRRASGAETRAASSFPGPPWSKDGSPAAPSRSFRALAQVGSSASSAEFTSTA
jgi:hypothetical protein